MESTLQNWLLVVGLALGSPLTACGQEGPPVAALSGDPNGSIAMPGPDQGWPPARYRLPAGRDPAIPGSHDPDPLLEEPGLPPPGWFGNVETDLTKVHFKNGLFDFVPISPGRTDLVHAPGADLDWTVAPRFDVGYRMPRGFGEFLISYRFLATEGAGDVTNDQGTTHLKSHLDLNTVDFVYGNRDRPMGPAWEMMWKVGVELSSFYYDSRADLANESGVLDQRVSNRFIGAGPYGALALSRQLPPAGLAAYTQVEGSALFGRIKQDFEETVHPSGASSLFGAVQDARGQAVGSIRVQAGLSWTPPRFPHSRLFLGYEWEYWIQVGRNDNTGSWGDFTGNGVFFRCEFSF
jgi:hypothetical protein